MRGSVTGRRPLGLTAPVSTAASPLPPSSPGGKNRIGVGCRSHSLQGVHASAEHDDHEGRAGGGHCFDQLLLYPGQVEVGRVVALADRCRAEQAALARHYHYRHVRIAGRLHRLLEARPLVSEHSQPWRQLHAVVQRGAKAGQRCHVCGVRSRCVLGSRQQVALADVAEGFCLCSLMPTP